MSGKLFVTLLDLIVLRRTAFSISTHHWVACLVVIKCSLTTLLVKKGFMPRGCYFKVLSGRYTTFITHQYSLTWSLSIYPLKGTLRKFMIAQFRHTVLNLQTPRYDPECTGHNVSVSQWHNMLYGDILSLVYI